MAELVLAVSFVLVLSFLCSLAEATLLSLTSSQVAEIDARSPRHGAVWRRFKGSIEKPIAVILLINTTAHTMGASFAGAEFDALYGDEWIAVFSLALTYLMLQFTEILPKSLGVRYNRELAVWMTAPLQRLIQLLSPVLQFVYWLNRPFERRRGAERAPQPLEEISALASAARLANQIGRHQERIIHGASRLSELRVRDMMIPGEQIAFLSAEHSLQEAFIAAHLEAHTRFPVCAQGDRDEVLGYVNFKELVYAIHVNPQEPSLMGIIRPVRFVGPEEAAASLLRSFVDEHVHMAIVRESERTVGLVTFEDLVEELVGELEDEFDRLPRMLHTLAGNVLMIGGGMPAAEVLARLGLPADGVRGTLSSWLADRIPAPPVTGARHREDGYDFAVRRTRRGRVFEVAVTPVRAAPAPDASV